MPEDKKGPKSTDTKREEEVTSTQNVAGANRDLEDRRQHLFGDNTSSSGGANNPGQHGRDGGEIAGVDNNPAPSEEAIDPNIAVKAAQVEEEKSAKKDEVRKL